MNLRTVEVKFGTPEYDQILAIRREVFVLEQGVPEALEVDAFEQTARYFLTYLEGQPTATGRLRVKGEWIKFERIATRSQARGLGIARALMETMEQAARQYSGLLPYMSAQVSAVPFYLKLGWHVVGDVFEEAGIPHLAMTRTW